MDASGPSVQESLTVDTNLSTVVDEGPEQKLGSVNLDFYKSISKLGFPNQKIHVIKTVCEQLSTVLHSHLCLEPWVPLCTVFAALVVPVPAKPTWMEPIQFFSY